MTFHVAFVALTIIVAGDPFPWAMEYHPRDGPWRSEASCLLGTGDHEALKVSVAERMADQGYDPKTFEIDAVKQVLCMPLNSPGGASFS